MMSTFFEENDHGKRLTHRPIGTTWLQKNLKLPYYETLSNEYFITMRQGRKKSKR